MKNDQKVAAAVAAAGLQGCLFTQISARKREMGFRIIPQIPYAGPKIDEVDTQPLEAKLHDVKSNLAEAGWNIAYMHIGLQ